MCRRNGDRTTLKFVHCKNVSWPQGSPKTCARVWSRHGVPAHPIELANSERVSSYPPCCWSLLRDVCCTQCAVCCVLCAVCSLLRAVLSVLARFSSLGLGGNLNLYIERLMCTLTQKIYFGILPLQRLLRYAYHINIK